MYFLIAKKVVARAEGATVSRRMFSNQKVPAPSRLDLSLFQLGKDPNHRPIFLQDLLASDLLVRIKDPTGSGPRRFELFSKDDEDYVATYSSELPIMMYRHKSQNYDTNENWIPQNAKTLFKEISPVGIALNPTDDEQCLVLFRREMIDTLLQGKLEAEPAHEYGSMESQQLQYCKPECPPDSELVEELKKFCIKHTTIIAAYHMQYKDPQRHETPLLGTFLLSSASNGFKEVPKLNQELGEFLTYMSSTHGGLLFGSGFVQALPAAMKEYLLREIRPFYFNIMAMSDEEFDTACADLQVFQAASAPPELVEELKTLFAPKKWVGASYHVLYMIPGFHEEPKLGTFHKLHSNFPIENAPRMDAKEALHHGAGLVEDLPAAMQNFILQEVEPFHVADDLL